MPSKLYFGSGEINAIKSIIENEFKTTNPMLVTDKGIVESGLTEKITSKLNQIEIFDRVEVNPRSTTINTAGNLARDKKIDMIIAMGGGSALDAGKAIAVLATNEGIIENYEGKEKYTHDPLPVLAIPTTCGTGSEVTWVAVITDTKRNFKMSVKGSKMYPAVSIVDPDFLLTLPKPIIASTGLDALTHAIEAYTVKPATLITDNFAIKAIKLIFSSIESACQDIKNNNNARESLMYGSTMAGFAFGNSDVGSVHCISESIGALFDIPHGVANAIFLPWVMKFNMPECVNKFSDIAFEIGIRENDNEKAAAKLIERIVALSQRLKIPTFTDLNINKDKYNLIAEYSFQNNSTPSNARDISVEDYLGILKDAHLPIEG